MSTSSGTTQGDKYRSYLDGEEEKNTKWRFGAAPNYDVVNKLFEEGRTKVCIQQNTLISLDCVWIKDSVREKKKKKKKKKKNIKDSKVFTH